MKILIISNSRCGSTNLMKSISSAQNIPYIFEPFLDNKPYDLNQSVVIKTLINQESLEFYRNFIPLFDKVILLSRRNIKEMVESLISLVDRLEENDFDYRKNLHLDKYEFNYDGDVTQHRLYEVVKERVQQLSQLSNEFNIPLDYYEDIFYTSNGLRDKTIKLDLSLINPENRLRKSDK